MNDKEVLSFRCVIKCSINSGTFTNCPNSVCVTEKMKSKHMVKAFVIGGWAQFTTPAVAFV